MRAPTRNGFARTIRPRRNALILERGATLCGNSSVAALRSRDAALRQPRAGDRRRRRGRALPTAGERQGAEGRRLERRRPLALGLARTLGAPADPLSLLVAPLQHVRSALRRGQ